MSSETDNRCPEREEEAPTGEAGAGGWPGRKPSGRRHTPVSGNTFPHHVTPGLRCPECPTKEATGASTAVGGRMGAFRPLLSQVTPRLSSPLPRCPAPDPDPAIGLLFPPVRGSVTPGSAHAASISSPWQRPFLSPDLPPEGPLRLATQPVSHPCALTGAAPLLPLHRPPPALREPGSQLCKDPFPSPSHKHQAGHFPNHRSVPGLSTEASCPGLPGGASLATKALVLLAELWGGRLLMPRRRPTPNSLPTTLVSPALEYYGAGRPVTDLSQHRPR